MDKFKSFIKGKKIEKHFKRSGPGVKLSETSNVPSVVSGSAQVRISFYFICFSLKMNKSMRVTVIVFREEE